MRVLWLITARAGSKSIPDKNIKLLGGKELLTYRIESALKTSFKKEVWLSTDNEKYAEIGLKAGANAPFIRPDYLASDTASSSDVVLHAMNYANEHGFTFDIIGLLEPTSPFISHKQLEEAVDLLTKNEEADGIVAVRESRPHSFFIQPESKYLTVLSDRFKEKKNVGRQFFKKEITPSGGFYIAKWGKFLKQKTFYMGRTMSFLVDDLTGLEIDEVSDWLFAEFIIENNIIDL
jgi:CMP-N-acetylneuraminic acid synthetase